ncbi:hypothetical protein J7E88_17070 [Streptomyces sp. ISL-10]|uniref:hypothetical protein n=1 Tax=Streptomyces sp. ISL-10 TaxID=2819172 RepID=UPI001BEC462F|nr:hypothetical protein [Streptomyces sp. ISL-10]MBT2366975.1 hypothetical protein [Streptomyces sp. ISL-10]
MPRPTAAQYAYGSATVVFSTVALLLLTRTTGGIAIAAIGVLALALGLAVALALPVRRSTAHGQPAAREADRAAANHASAPATSAAAHDGLTTRVPAPRARAGVAGHSLRR